MSEWGSTRSVYDDLQLMLQCFLSFWDLPGFILKFVEALGEVLVNLHISTLTIDGEDANRG